MKSAIGFAMATAAVVLGLACLGCSECQVGTSGPKESGEAAASVGAGTACEFAVEGMSCDGCVNHLTKELKNVPGVQSVAVSLKDKKAVVTADQAKAPPEKIVAAIAEAGYEGKLIPPKP